MTSTKEKKAVGPNSSPPSSAEGWTRSVTNRPPAGSGKASEKPLRVFLADDSRLVSERLTALLAAVEGVQIIGVARTAGGAIRGIQHLLPDVVILDFQLPDGNGLEVLKALQQEQQKPLVMMLTNFFYPQYRAECMQYGASYFFDKSQDFEQVVEICKQLVSSPPSRTEMVIE